MLGEPGAHLGGGDREGGDGGDVGGGGALAHHDRERHVKGQFGEDLQRCADGQAVEGGQHRALDGVLDGHAGVVGVAAAHGGHRVGGAVAAQRGHVGGSGRPRDEPGGHHLAQRRLGERSLWAQVGDARHAPTLSAERGNPVPLRTKALRPPDREVKLGSP
ncbi:hypothetical protein MPHL21000_08695 [Mycolicibacterium phlei DSM 43239 = CCUG 21000]|uniref:Uncharacterized protein n=1 Tax=Mycolicibacterium phlei DSM 43239 = CCUG 21000 TaxID=1226750 RepID=A0A5N5V9E6_MYCPH|nr:hypothetical protein MPHL21000_08695 [Mycolicibacterium phlei DSM 43239 = CCUG 21000]KXW65092.1 hypothetical protein MPHL43239_10770 [Mycolicibacterium phlei DSM 43239 = CCUG 21000]